MSYTGGKHRLVCMTEALAGFLHTRFPDYTVQVNHRERSRWGSQKCSG